MILGSCDAQAFPAALVPGGTGAPSSAARHIPPGESAELIVRYDPAAHPQPGNYVREVYIYSIDPRLPKAVFTITATTR